MIYTSSSLHPSSHLVEIVYPFHSYLSYLYIILSCQIQLLPIKSTTSLLVYLLPEDCHPHFGVNSAVPTTTPKLPYSRALFAYLIFTRYRFRLYRCRGTYLLQSRFRYRFHIWKMPLPPSSVLRYSSICLHFATSHLVFGLFFFPFSLKRITGLLSQSINQPTID